MKTILVRSASALAACSIMGLLSVGSSAFGQAASGQPSAGEVSGSPSFTGEPSGPSDAGQPAARPSITGQPATGAASPGEAAAANVQQQFQPPSQFQPGTGVQQSAVGGEPTTGQPAQGLGTQQNPPMQGMPNAQRSGADPAANSLGDQQITAKVVNELSGDPAVAGGSIVVTSKNGVVTLAGSVDSLLAEERALKLAETIEGVELVVDNVEVRPSPVRSDRAILRDVQNALGTVPARGGYAVQAEVTNGIVSLSGQVGAWSQRNLAETVAKSIPGVRGVANQISVDYSAPRTDADIAEDIRNLLKWNVYVKNWPALTVAVSDGEVKITGTVDSAAERSVVRSLAQVDGVRTVDVSDVDVRDWTVTARKVVPPPAPMGEASAVEMAVKSALMRDPRVNSQDVNVEADGSTVVLSGTVYNPKSKVAAEQDAQNALGVEVVINRIRVRTAGAPEDEDIVHAIRTAFLRDPFVKSENVRVTVTDGIATIDGVVNNHFEKAHASIVAARTIGVESVNNELAVNWTVPLYVYKPYVDEYDLARFGVGDLHALERPRTDLEIEESIKTELFWSPLVPDNEVTVSVKNGVATLSGTVASWTEKAAAAENAIEGGAMSVANNIVVAPIAGRQAFNPQVFR